MIRINDISFFSCTGPRPNQEDYIVVSDDKATRVIVLCDGMGGHGHGEIASKTIAESVYNYLATLAVEEFKPEDLQIALDQALPKLHEADIYDDAKKMGTTLVVVAINRMNILVGHVGDSRCYLFSTEGGRKFRTKDHSKVQEAVDAEILTEEEAWSNPKKNIVTRCIMSDTGSVKVDVDKITVEDGDILMLCSDGVTDAMRDKQIQATVIGRKVSEIAECIKNECALSSHDNFSAVIVSLSQDEKNPAEEKEDALPGQAPATDTPAELPMRRCHNCGNEMPVTASFCPHCGRKAISPASTNISYHPEIIDIMEPSKPKMKFWMLAAALVIGMIFGWFIGHSSSGNDKNMIEESHITSFVNEICAIKDDATADDSVISKPELSKKYTIFIDNLKNENLKINK